MSRMQVVFLHLERARIFHTTSYYYYSTAGSGSLLESAALKLKGILVLVLWQRAHFKAILGLEEHILSPVPAYILCTNDAAVCECVFVRMRRRESGDDDDDDLCEYFIIFRRVRTKGKINYGCCIIFFRSTRAKNGKFIQFVANNVKCKNKKER